MFSYETAFVESVKYFDGDELAAKVFLDKYALRDKAGNILEDTPVMMHKRMAQEFSRIEKNKFKDPLSEETIFNYFDRFKYIVPQGSPMFGIGNNHQVVSLSNCYVLTNPHDSYSSILQVDEELVNISKRRGGVGIDLTNLRPAGTPTNNAARASTGIISWMERYSNSIREVGQGGRRGALMLTLSVHHPDILAFSTIKNDNTKVTGANISVKLSQEFLDALKNESDYELRWPEENPIIRKMVSAKEVWNTIIHSAWLRAEPGILMWDNIKNGPAECYDEYKSVSTNPCAEISLSSHDSCRLIAINLLSYVNNPFTDSATFNFQLFYNHAQIAQRLMDDLVDLESEKIDQITNKIKNDPEPDDIKRNELALWSKIKRFNNEGRRTGLGITALGDTLAALSIPYGSDESIGMTEEIYKCLKLGAYRSSVDMAKELGSFKAWNSDNESNCDFLTRISDEKIFYVDHDEDIVSINGDEIYNDIQKYGRRNIALLTTAPTGSVSIMTQTTSGIEPLFMTGYTRRKKINPNDKNAKADFTDQNGDSWQEFTVYHPTIKKWMDITGKTDVKESPWFGCCAEDIDWINRVRMQAAAQKHVCHAISSCLHENSMILTNDGPRQLGQFDFGEEKTFNDISNKNISSVNVSNESAKITATYNNGPAQTIIFKLSGGREIQCTPNHKICVLSKDYKLDWKSAEEIVESDIVVGRKGLNLWTKDNRFISIEEMIGSKFEQSCAKNANKFYIPEKLSKDLCRLIGYMCSDGSIGVNGISLCQLENNVCDDFQKIVSDIFGLKTRKVRDVRSNRELYNICGNSRQIRDYFKWLGLTKHDENMELPKCIYHATKKQVCEFIKGLTLDGHVSKHNICVMTSVSKKFLLQVSLLLENLGVESRVEIAHRASMRKFPHSEKLRKTKDAYTLLILKSKDIQKFVDLIGFAEERKNKEITTKYIRGPRVKSSGQIPDYGIREKFNSEIIPKIRSEKIYNYFKNLIRKSNHGMFLSIESLKEMIDLGLDTNPILTDDTYTFNRIQNISDGGIINTYDLSVPDKNSYIANGIISHNTINLPEDVQEDEISKIYVEAFTAGCKGITVYRKNCRTGVLVDNTNAKGKDDSIQKTNAPKRPLDLPCDVHAVTIKGKPYVVFVGILNGEPYEVFAGLNTTAHVPHDVSSGIIRKTTRPKGYKFVYADFEIFPIGILMDDFEEALTRMVSTSLRHGADIPFIVGQLQKTNGDLTSFAKAIARTLKKYIKDGSNAGKCSCGGNMIFEEGCSKCMSCGNSKCG